MLILIANWYYSDWHLSLAALLRMEYCLICP